MFRLSLLIGKIVFDLERQEEFGTIEKLIFQTNELRILAFEVRPKGILKGKRFLLFNDIDSINSNQVNVINRKKLLRPIKAIKVREALVNEIKILKTLVVDSNYSEIGRIKDAFCDSKNGRIKKIEIKQSLLVRIASGRIFIKAEAIEKIEKDKLILKENYKNHLETKPTSASTRMADVYRKTAVISEKTRRDFQKKEISFCLNKLAVKDIIDKQGEFLVKKGQIIDKKIIEKVVKAGMIHELALSVGLEKAKASLKKFKNR